MNGAAIRVGLIRASLIAGSFVLGTIVLGRAAMPGPIRAAGMLALPFALLAVLRREDRRLGRAAGGGGPGSLGPPLRRLLLRQRGKLDEASHR